MDRLEERDRKAEEDKRYRRKPEGLLVRNLEVRTGKAEVEE